MKQALLLLLLMQSPPPSSSLQNFYMERLSYRQLWYYTLSWARVESVWVQRQWSHPMSCASNTVIGLEPAEKYTCPPVAVQPGGPFCSCSLLFSLWTLLSTWVCASQLLAQSCGEGAQFDPLPGAELKADFPMPVSCLGIPGWHDASLQSGGRPLCASNRAWMFAQGFVENLHYCPSHQEANWKSPFWCEANFIFVLYLRFYKLSQLPVVASKN